MDKPGVPGFEGMGLVFLIAFIVRHKIKICTLILALGIIGSRGISVKPLIDVFGNETTLFCL